MSSFPLSIIRLLQWQQLLFFFFFFISIPTLLLAITCPNCGNTSVPYPLSTHPTCGNTHYTLNCTSSNHLMFQSLSGSYPIIAIHPQSQRLLIRPSPISPSSCTTSDLPQGGLLLNDSLPFNITSTNTVFLLNCSTRLLLSPLNCSSNNLCSQFVQHNSAGQPCANQRCCTFTAGGSSTSYKLSVDELDCTAYASFPSLDPSLNARNWQSGVELEWVAPTEPPCRTQKDCILNSVCQTDNTTNLLKCLCNSGYHWDPSSGVCAKDPLCSDGENGLNCTIGHSHKAAVIAGTTVGFAFAVVVICAAIVISRRRRIMKEARDKLSRERQEILSANSGGKSAKLFTSREMKRATQWFAKERLLGSGAFGDVYKGKLNDGTVVAVKSAKIGNIKGVEQVLNEVRVLSQVNHRNLVRLLGCCVEAEQPLLVYEYISNGTLLQHLNGSKGSFLDWKTRLTIALQTAQGLAYLHSAAYPPIYHRDVKSSNILLDDTLNAKVSDFGLSRLAEPGLTHVSTCAQGTLGYLDPEYYRNYQLTDKSDVYSFGVVLLELVTSQKAIDFTRGQDDVNLAIYVLNNSEAGKVMEAVDPGLCAGSLQIELDTMRAVAFLALSCLQESRTDRPTMKEVADELEFIINTLGPKYGKDQKQ